jgi:hypothetical protein
MGAPCVSPTFCAACKDADRRRARGEAPKHIDPALWHTPTHPTRRPTPQVTIEAILYSVRERGLGALKEPDNIERLSRCDEAAQKELKGRIQRMTEGNEKGGK